MKLLMIIGLVWCSASFAKDDWFCTTQSSERTGNLYKVCGIGEHTTESEAREAARVNAFAEFNALCKNSPGCRSNLPDLNPKRTECTLENGTYKCLRLFEVELVSAISATNPPQGPLTEDRRALSCIGQDQPFDRLMRWFGRQFGEPRSICDKE